jgi:hypothetical protein
MSLRYFQLSLLIAMTIFTNSMYSQANPNNMEPSGTQEIDNRILAILTLDMENIPSDFQEIIKHEKEVVAHWKEEGILENLFLRQGNGAILIFIGVDEEKAKELMETLPLYKLKKSVEYFRLVKQF